MRTVQILLLIMIVACGNLVAQSERSHLRDGNNAYKEKKYTDAEVSYKKALEKNHNLVEGSFNLGDALYKQDRYNEAAEQYQAAAAKAKDNDTKAQAMHNLGNTLLQDKKIPESIAAYKEALKLNPKDNDTKYNYEYAKRLLMQQQQQQQQKQQKQDDKKQDQKKQDQQQKQDQQKQQQQKQQEDQQKQQQAQQKKQQISKADAERILEALKNDEKKVQKKLQKKAPARVQVEKDW